MEWIDQWIGERGGGLCMVGGERSFAAGGWLGTPVADLLPVDLLTSRFDWLPGEAVKVEAQFSAAPHPLWTIVADESQNRQIVAAMPEVQGLNRFAGVRSDFAAVLATTRVAAADPLAPLPRGLGDAALLPGTLPTAAALADAAEGKNSSAALPAIVAGRYGRGRTAAVAFPITSPNAENLSQKWGQGDNRYFAKFCRNLIYWLSENSAIGRRRLIASADKRFYRPGETIHLTAAIVRMNRPPRRQDDRHCV